MHVGSTTAGRILVCFAVAVILFSDNRTLAQNPPADTQQPAPLDVPPEFLKPQNPQDGPAPPAAPQGAQPDNASEPAAMIGAWEFSNADHDRICHLNFRGDTVAGGYRLDVDKNCPNLFPSTKDIVAWATDGYGNLRLLDAGGNAIIELTEVEGGMFDGFSPEEGRYILQTAAAAAPTRTADDMVGDWSVSRGNGKPICTITLANNPAPNSPAGDVLALKLKPGCDPFVTRFAPSAWRMDQGALVLLLARGQTWQFEENDANTWQRVPESSDPVLLVRH